ncbi:MAG: PrsW family intramembrane metalloprotease [Candidatus Sulfotelmatobacter sp.]
MFCPACGAKVESGATFCRLCGKPQFAHANAQAPPAPAGTPSANLQPAQRPTPPAAIAQHARNHSPAHLVQSLEDRLRRLAGTEKLEGFSLPEMFSEVFKKHSPAELDEYFVTGTARTTPRIEDVPAGWPKPWFFFRVLIFVVGIYLLFDYIIQEFGNPNAIPGLLFMGSLAVPLTVLVLFFELNVTRDVSFVGVLSLFASGAIVGFIFTHFLSSVLSSSLSWMGASVAGIIEEIAKLLAVCVIVGRRRHRFILNGILFGAAVGAGFAVFESMGYAFVNFRDSFLIAAVAQIRHAISNSPGATVPGIMNYLLNIMNDPKGFIPDKDALNNMISLIQLRAWLSPFGHVAWTAIAAGGLWRVKGNRDLEMRMFFQPQFLRVFSIPVVLHMAWDMPWERFTAMFLNTNNPPEWPAHLVRLGLGLIGWFILLGLVQQGLHQVKDEQIAHARVALEQAKAVVPGTAEPMTAPVVN